MSQQSKRPLSSSGDARDAAEARRRELTAARVRRFRERQQAIRQPKTQPSQAQLSQGEQIIDFGPTLELETAQTLLSLGLRINGLTLAQDSTNIPLQQDAIPVDEHVALYSTPHLDPEPQTPRPRSLTQHPSGQSKLTGFVSIQPRGNPFAQPALSTIPTPTIRPSPRQPSFSPLSILTVSTSRNQQGSEDLIYASNDQEHSSSEENNDSNDEFFNTHDDFISATEDADHPRNDSLDLRREELEHTQDGMNTQELATNAVNNDNNRSPTRLSSERSSHSSDEEDEVAATDSEVAVNKVLALFQDAHLGCTDEQHDQQNQQHMTEVADHNHYGLSEIFHNTNTISVLASPELLTPARLAQYTQPTVHQLHSTFCGISPTQPRPQYVCLHREETQAQPCHQAYDIDSYLGFLSSLGACRQGLWHQPVPQARQNMTSDIHIQTPTFTANDDDPEQVPRSTLAMLRDVPHFLLGRVVGAHDITIYVLFPHLDQAADRFVSLTKEQLTRWLDRVFNPALHNHYPSHYTQHIPSSFRHALANSKARQVEGRQVETASYQAQQSLGHHLQPENLADVWADILHTVDTTPGVRDFREPQLFFSAKGSKLQFKTNPSRPSLLEAMEYFESYLGDVFVPEFVDWQRTYVDLAFEVCPKPSHLTTQGLPEGEEPQILSWKRCCQEKIIHELYDGRPPSQKGPGQRYYTQNMLYDITNVSSAPPKQTTLYKGGVRYLQLYGSVKEVWDAAQCRPFDNDGLEEMALDPLIRQGARSLAHGRRRDNTIIERGYCASKTRIHQALRDSRKKSFGVRGEVRATWDLFRAIMDRLRLTLPEQTRVQYPRAPSYTWAVKTPNYLNFLWRNADKFASLFEMVRARTGQEIVTWEQTKIMAMSLRCLRFVLGAHQLSRESALWWSRRERTVGDPPSLKIWYGLGFSNTLPRYGFCWLEPRIDWAQLVFRPAITDRVLFGNDMLRRQYLQRGGQVQDFFNTTRRLDLALMWLARPHHTTQIRKRLLFWIVHICLQQFRVDVINSIQTNVKPDCYDEARLGVVPFSYDYLQEILVEDVYLISGNRCDFKKPSDLGRFLFGFDDGRVRNHWDNRPFRKLFQRAQLGLSLLGLDVDLVPTFLRRFWRSLFAYHWVLPYPSVEVFTQTTKQGLRMMYSIELKENTTQDISLVDTKQWQWARKEWRGGHPPDIPAYASWTRDEWEDWIARNGLVDPAPAVL